MRHLLYRAVPIAVLLVAAAALITACAVYVTRGSFLLERLASSDEGIHSDWQTFYASARALIEGRDIYATGAPLPNLNPPLFTALVGPLGWLEFLPSYRLWVLVSVGLVVGSMVAVTAELRLRAATAVPVILGALVSAPMIATLGLGQMYPLLTAGLVGAWLAERRGRQALTGVALGLTVALKPSLAPVLLVPALRGQWLACSSALLTGSAATVAGWIVCGGQSTPTWARLLADNPMQTFWDNAALPGTLLRLTSATDWGRPVVEIPGGTTIGLVLGGVVLAVTAWLVRRPPVDGPDPALWAMAAAALLASPLSWFTYLVVLLPGLLVLAARGRWALVALLLSVSLIGAEWASLWYDDQGVPAVPVSMYCGILLAYWASLLHRPQRRWDSLLAPAGGEDVTARPSVPAAA